MKHCCLAAIAALLMPCLLIAQNPKLKDVNLGSVSSNPSNFISLSNGTCFFTADGDDADTDKELYYYSDINGTQKVDLRDATHISATALFLTPARSAAQGAHYTGASWAFDAMSNITTANGHLTSSLSNITSFSPFTLTSNPNLLQTWTGGTGPGGVANTTGTDNLKIWLKADADAFTDAGNRLATQAQTITQWSDKSGAGNHVKIVYCKQANSIKRLR